MRYYEFVIQEKVNGLWMDRFQSYDRKAINQIKRILKEKNPYSIFRVVRLCP